MTLFKPSDDAAMKAMSEHECVFEIWDRSVGAMGRCGAPAYGYATRPANALCRDCWEEVRGRLGSKATIEQFYASTGGVTK